AGRYTQVEDCLANEVRPIRTGDGRHEVAAHVAVDHVEAVADEQQDEQHGEKSQRPPAHFRAEEVLDAPDETSHRMAVDRDSMLAHDGPPSEKGMRDERKA